MNKLIILSVLFVSVVLSSCSWDDDESVYKQYILAPTDVQSLGLLGKVKSYTINNWSNYRFEYDTVLASHIYHKYEYKFNTAGYIETFKHFLSSSYGGELNLYDSKSYDYDKQNRIITIEYANKSSINIYKDEFIYDDINKTVTKYRYTPNGEYWRESGSVYVYQQNAYGRIDYDNYEVFPRETRAIISDKNVVKYDCHGNPIECYKLYTFDNGDKYLSDYITYTYEYYK